MDGGIVQVEFTFVDLETQGNGGCWDFMTILDGPDANSPPILNSFGETAWCSSGTNLGTGSLVDDGPFVSSSAGGCLTFSFSSDGSVQSAGWEAFVSCYNPNFVINGVAFQDENENGTYEDGEQLLYNQELNLEPVGLASVTNSAGLSTFYVDLESDYTISINPTAVWNVNGPSSVPVSVGSIGLDTTVYFALTPVGDFAIQSVDIASSITRCNWDVNYWITYSNDGTVTTDGWVDLIPDPNTEFVSADPMPDEIADDGTLLWYYDDLTPSLSRQIKVVYNMPGFELLDTPIVFESNIATNDDEAGDKYTLAEDLLCAYDPNDKQVSPYGYGEDNYALFDDILNYTVRFQNTGNDTAFNIVIRDTIDANLDLGTFELVSSSHEVSTLIREATRIIEFSFENILLADSFINEPLSHGFVKYSILSNGGLNENTPVNNTAGIYFDFNPVVLTNTVSNTMVSVLPELGRLDSKEEELDFGNVLLGENEELTLSILNTGDLELNILDIILQDHPEVYGFSFTPSQLQGGEELIIPVSFIPQMVQLYPSSLLIRSDQGDKTVALKGAGETDSGFDALNLLLEISPNPSNGIFTLNWKGETSIQSAQYEIFDSSGKLLMEQKLQGQTNRIDLSSYSSGVYFIKMETDQGNFMKKLIVR